MSRTCLREKRQLPRIIIPVHLVPRLPGGAIRGITARRWAMRLTRITLGLVLLVPPSFTWTQTKLPLRPKEPSPLGLVQTAHTLFTQGDLESARRYYLKALPSYPRDFHILKNLGECYYVLGPRGFAQAVHFYKRAYEVKPDAREVAEKLARTLTALRRFGEAAELLRKVTASPASTPEEWKDLAQTCEAAGRFAEAERAYDAYLQRNPSDLRARTSLANLYSREKAYDKALGQFRRVLSANPIFPPGLAGMARMLSWKGQYAESLKLYDRVLRFEPRNGEAQSGKAFVLLWLGRSEESLAIFTRLHQRFPGDQDLARGMQDAQVAVDEKVLAGLRRAGDPAQIEAYYRQRLARNPKDAAALRELARLNSDPQRCSQGIEYGLRALLLVPDSLEIELDLAHSLAACKQYGEAVTRYRRFLGRQPKSAEALDDLGGTLMRANRYAEAIHVLRRLLELSPQNSRANLELAQALVATRQYSEALTRYDQTLASAPDHYDALQGKAFILYWTGRYAQAASVFRRLVAKRPDDPQNAQALQEIARAQEEARWAAIRPRSNAPLQTFLEYYTKRLASYPDDKDAMKGLAYVQAQLKNIPTAISAYRRVLTVYPDDTSSKKELANLLGREGHHDASIRLYKEVLADTPDDVDSLENLARVYVWSHRDQEALRVYRGLLERYPSNSAYSLERARIEMRLKDFAAARNTLASLLPTDPRYHEARTELANLKMLQGDYPGSLRLFHQLLQEDPCDAEALLGKARISYYQGKFREARASALTLVTVQPDNFEGIVLLASIEHAQGRRRMSLALLQQAERLNPGNPEVLGLRKRVQEESTITIHTSASYAREIGSPPPCPDPQGCGALDLHQDLRTFAYGTTLGFPLLPRTDSYLAFNLLPSESPPGRGAEGAPVPTGITGTAAPAEFLYRQATHLSPRFTLRVGAGVVRFGPGRWVAMPSLFVLPPESRPVVTAGFTATPWKWVGFDFSFDRSPVTYTPTAVRFAVMEQRYQAGINFLFGTRTDLHVEAFYASYASTARQFVALTRPTTRTQLDGGKILFSRNFVRRERFALDMGYAGQAFGHFRLGEQRVFLGFFNPNRYSRHLLRTRLAGKLWGPFAYDLSGGFGIQTPDEGLATKNALEMSPSLEVRVNRHLSFSFGYTYYNTSQALGRLRGNALRIAIDQRY